MNPLQYPSHIFSGYYAHCGHCQGIATDGKYMYYSFTTELVKTDLDGHFVGSATGLTGHLGCIAWCDEYHAVIGSLEYKNDAIGRGILSSLGKADEKNDDAFYIARFDTDKIIAADMDAVRYGIMTVVRLADVCDDYAFPGHRYGCSGIDGITVVPDFDGKCNIFVAYGIYQDVNRTDNDNQVLLRFDTVAIDSAFGSTDAIRGEYFFVYTGNTNWGIQNIEYDVTTDCIIAAVYPGCKPQFPNYPMFFIDIRHPLDENGNRRFPLCNRGLCDTATGIRGSNFPYGSTGMIALGDGYYYFSHHQGKNGIFATDVYRYCIDGEDGFIRG